MRRNSSLVGTFGTVNIVSSVLTRNNVLSFVTLCTKCQACDRGNPTNHFVTRYTELIILYPNNDIQELLEDILNVATDRGELKG